MVKPSFKDYFFIITGSALLLIPFLGRVHLFDWDEINFAECAREMIVTKNYFSVMINYQPFWEKPPLFIWMQALSMNLFGINEFSARLPDAICGVITFMVIFTIGTKLYDKKFGWLWVLCYAGSILPHFYFQSGIIDPWFNLFIFLSVYYFILLVNSDSKKALSRNLVFSALFAGLAILTKGPAAVLIISLCIVVYAIIKRTFSFISFRQAVWYFLIACFTGGLWFIIEIVTGHWDIVLEFFNYQVRLFKTEDAGHGGPFYYHFLVLLLGCFPASIFAIRAFGKKSFDPPFEEHFRLWMKILFWVVLILFSIVKTKIVHYSSLCYFPITFLAAYSLYQIVKYEFVWKKWMSFLIGFLGILISVVMIVASLMESFKKKIIDSGIIHDNFALENLKSHVKWGGYEFLIGLLLLFTILFSLFSFNKKRFMTGISSLFTGCLIVTSLFSVFVVPKIERYSQGAAIEFYSYLKGKDVYIETLGFKSYAHLFYSAKMPMENPAGNNIDWLLKGKIDKPAYFVSKVDRWDNIKNENRELIEIYRKNGFVFSKRNP